MKRLSGKALYLSNEVKTLIVGMICLGGVALAWGLVNEQGRTWTLLLLNGVYFVTLAVSGVFFLSVQYVTGSRWSDVVRRVPEAISGLLPYAAIPMLFLFFGLHTLYHWSHTHAVESDDILAGKSIYLNAPFFFVRMIVIIALWIFFARRMRRNSHQEDEFGGTTFHRRNVRLSAGFLVVFGITFSIASFDWVMSLDPHWYSTIFAIYNFAGMFTHGLAMIALVAILLQGMGVMPNLREDHVHDLAKLIFAALFFWAYIWYAQFVLIWYGNIPEETVYFAHLVKGDWSWLFYTNFFMNFVAPFLVLLPRPVKRNPDMVMRVCILLLVGRWLDLYLMIAPGVLQESAFIGLLEVVVTLGFAGIFVFLIRRQLAKASLIPLRSEHLKDSLSYHQ